MWLPKLKRLFFALLPLCFFLHPVFSQGVYLTETEFQELLNLIKTSRTNSQEQTNLITDLKETLRAQEAALLQALNSLEQSETDLTELKASLSRIQGYSEELNAYCLTLEQENAGLRTENRRLKTWLGVSSGSAGALIIVLLILLL
jgi:septal ring factor EnvC (AmiA/AmiB activator)